MKKSYNFIFIIVVFIFFIILCFLIFLRNNFIAPAHLGVQGIYYLENNKYYYTSKYSKESLIILENKDYFESQRYKGLNNGQNQFNIKFFSNAYDTILVNLRICKSNRDEFFFKILNIESVPCKNYDFYRIKSLKLFEYVDSVFISNGIHRIDSIRCP